MKQIYARKWSEVADASHSKYVLSERIPPGNMLHVHNCFANAAGRTNGDRTEIGVRNGGQDIIVRSRGGNDNVEGLSSLNGFFVGESDLVYAYFPNADNNETIELHVIGVLYSLDEWRKLTG